MLKLTAMVYIIVAACGRAVCYRRVGARIVWMQCLISIAAALGALASAGAW